MVASSLGVAHGKGVVEGGGGMGEREKFRATRYELGPARSEQETHGER